MGNVINSIDNVITSQANNGEWPVFIFGRSVSSTTAALTTCGYTSIQKLENTFRMMPSFGTGVTGALLTSIYTNISTATRQMVCGIEYELATIDMNTGSASFAETMPNKVILGDTIQTASLFTLMVVTSSVTATTPTMSITYVNQNGDTGRTASLVLPTSPTVRSCFQVNPHLQSGDTGIRSVTGLTKSAGTAGTIKIYGILPLAIVNCSATSFSSSVGLFNTNLPKYPIAASENIGFYLINTTTTCSLLVKMGFTGDN